MQWDLKRHSITGQSSSRFSTSRSLRCSFAALMVVDCPRLTSVNCKSRNFLTSAYSFVERYSTASADPHSELYQRAKPHPFLHGQRRQPLLRRARRHLLLRPFTVNEDNHLAMRVVTASVNVTQQLLHTHILSLSEGETKRTSCLFRSYCKMTFQCRHVCCHRRPPYLATRIVTCLPFRSLQDE